MEQVEFEICKIKLNSRDRKFCPQDGEMGGFKRVSVLSKRIGGGHNKKFPKGKQVTCSRGQQDARARLIRALKRSEGESRVGNSLQGSNLH